MVSGPGFRADASYGERQAGAALAILQFLAPFIKEAINFPDEAWNIAMDSFISVYGSGASEDAAEVRRVLEQMRAR